MKKNCLADHRNNQNCCLHQQNLTPVLLYTDIFVERDMTAPGQEKALLSHGRIFPVGYSRFLPVVYQLRLQEGLS